MPPKAKLHNRNGKLKSLPRSKPSAFPGSSSSSAEVSNPSSSAENTAVTNNDQQFEVELCWCVHQLEEALSSNKLTPKQGSQIVNVSQSENSICNITIVSAQESVNILNVLKCKKQLTVRKRQLMRTHFGDYRAKMAAEEKKAKTSNVRYNFF